MNLLKNYEQLPSVRSLATSLQINPMTISKAFTQLELEGVLIRKRGVGMLVAEQQGQAISQQINQSLTQFIVKARNESLEDEAIMTLVQQYLSINNKG